MDNQKFILHYCSEKEKILKELGALQYFKLESAYVWITYTQINYQEWFFFMNPVASLVQLPTAPGSMTPTFIFAMSVCLSACLPEGPFHPHSCQVPHLPFTSSHLRQESFLLCSARRGEGRICFNLLSRMWAHYFCTSIVNSPRGSLTLTLVSSSVQN